MNSIANTHRHYSKDWWTPPEWMEWVYATLGTRDVFDPCPRDWSPESGYDGLVAPWHGPAYVNHPGTKSRGAAARWWEKYQQERSRGLESFIWCAFSCEQRRHMRPSPMLLPGWLIEPRVRVRVQYIWGGPDDPERGLVHGELGKSPGNWSVFWSTKYPATPPVESVIVRTGSGRSRRRTKRPSLPVQGDLFAKGAQL